MDMFDAVLGDQVRNQMSQQIGASPQQTGNAIQAALPMLLAGLHLNAQQPGGAASLLSALQKDHDGSVLSNLSGLISGQTGGQAGNGSGILGHILGDKQDSAQGAVAQASGIGAPQASQLMTMLAPIVMGALGKMQRSQNLDASGLQSAIKDEHANATQAQPGLMGFATQLLGAGGTGGAPGEGGSGLEGMMKEIGGLLGKN